MKKIVYSFPKSSFLSTDKDLDLIVDKIIKNDRMKKMLYYTSSDCLDQPNLTQAQTAELFKTGIKIVPKLYIDGAVKNYILISFDNFYPNKKNPEFRNNVVEFDIVCHYDQWHLKDFALRPYKIAAEIDSMFNEQRLTGIGKLEFISGSQIVLSDEYAGICLQYLAIHGEEDKINALNPLEEEDLDKNFDKVFNLG